MPKLVVMAKGKPREIEMGQELTIGRGYSNLLRLEGDEISRVHAIIFRRGDDFVLRDLDSKNGVFVNGSKINHAQLDSGDRLQVGKYRMVFNPPPEFDLKNLDDSEVGADKYMPLLSKAQAAPEDEYMQSRRFKVAIPSDNSSGIPGSVPSPATHEEISFFTRGDLDRLNKEHSARVSEIVSDYNDLFFDTLLSTQPPDKNFAEGILAALVEAISANRGVIILRDPATGDLSSAAILSQSPDVAVNRVVLKSGLSEGKALLCPQTRECGLFRDNDTVNRDRIATLISVPLGDDPVKGIVYVDRIEEADAFHHAHLILVVRISRLLELYFGNQKTDSVAKGAG